jgi:hypothetical protein
MSKNIYDVTVNKLALVSKDEIPAVPKAGNQYAIFKVKKKQTRKVKLLKTIEKLQGKTPIEKKSLQYVIKKLED